MTKLYASQKLHYATLIWSMFILFECGVSALSTNLNQQFTNTKFDPLFLTEPFSHLGPMIVANNTMGVTNIVFASKNFGSWYGQNTAKEEQYCRFRLLFVVSTSYYWWEDITNAVVTPRVDEDMAMMLFGCHNYAGSNMFMIPSYNGKQIIGVYPVTNMNTNLVASPAPIVMTLNYTHLYWTEAPIDWSAVPQSWLNMITPGNFILTSCNDTGYLLFGINATVYPPANAFVYFYIYVITLTPPSGSNTSWVAAAWPTSTQRLAYPIPIGMFGWWNDLTFCSLDQGKPTLFLFNTYNSISFYLTVNAGWRTDFNVFAQTALHYNLIAIQQDMSMSPSLVLSNMNGTVNMYETAYNSRGILGSSGVVDIIGTFGGVYFAFSNRTEKINGTTPSSVFWLNGEGGVSYTTDLFRTASVQLLQLLTPGTIQHTASTVANYFTSNGTLYSFYVMSTDVYQNPFPSDTNGTFGSIFFYQSNVRLESISPLFVSFSNVVVTVLNPIISYDQVMLTPPILKNYFGIDSQTMECVFVMIFNQGNFVFCPTIRRYIWLQGSYFFSKTSNVIMVGYVDLVVIYWPGPTTFSTITVLVGLMNPYQPSVSYQIQPCFTHVHPPGGAIMYPAVLGGFIFLIERRVLNVPICPIVVYGYPINLDYSQNCSSSYSFEIGANNPACQNLTAFSDFFMALPLEENILLLALATIAPHTIAASNANKGNTLIFLDMIKQQIQTLPAAFPFGSPTYENSYFLEDGLVAFDLAPFSLNFPYVTVATVLSCPAGYYGAAEGAPVSTLCVICPIGTYSSLPNSTECTPCTRPVLTAQEGSTSPFQCNLCNNNYCHNHGACFATINDAICQCDFGYSASDLCALPWFFIVLGTVSLVVLVLIAIVYVYRRWRRRWSIARDAQVKLTYEIVGIRENQAHMAEEIDDFKKSWTIAWESLTQNQLIASGGFGNVYRSFWGERIVAVKVLKDTNNSPDQLQEFERECLALRQYRHPQIVLFFGSGVNDRHEKYVVTEFVDLGSLYGVLHSDSEQHRNALTWAARCHMAVDVAMGVEFLHRQNPPVIHRDLKSPNVFVTDKYRCKIGDLGLARRIALPQPDLKSPKRKDNQSEELELTQPLLYETVAAPNGSGGTMTAKVGTLLWTAPEIVRGAKDYHLPVDIYACGIVFWELATNLQPFYGTTDWGFDIASRIMAGGRPTWPDVHFATNTRDYIALAEQCWHDDSNRRPTAVEVVANLSMILSGPSV